MIRPRPGLLLRCPTNTVGAALDPPNSAPAFAEARYARELAENDANTVR